MAVDIRSDLYSLGVTLWEMLTGKVPFRGTPGEVMSQHQRAPLPLEQLEAVPQPVVVLIEVMLEKDPGHRFQNPAELGEVMPLVREAIDAGRRLKKTVRVFVSSTGDVQKESYLADGVMRSIAAEFGVPISTSCWNFQCLAKKMRDRNLIRRIMGRWFYVPFFGNMREVATASGLPGTDSKHGGI